MKPLKLIMSAFGPYKDQVEVDFTKVGNNGIFLITGDTGAGKTTIFDGISFALFGESSGSNRESISLRSKFAKSDTETFVELTFTHRDKVYTITRNPSYLVPKKRGNGETIKSSDATLKYDENIIAGLKTVNEKITDILGINSKQFKQIAMLAQGEFLKILFADSDERKTVFRKIFNTEVFDLITAKLNEKHKNNKENIESIKTEFITNVNNINFSENIIDIDKSNLTEENITKIIEYLKSELNLNLNKVSELEKSIVIKDKELKQLEERIKQIATNNQKLMEYNLLKQEEQQLKEKEPEINKTIEIIEQNNKILRIIKPIEINIVKFEQDIKDTLDKIDIKIMHIKEYEEEEQNVVNKEKKLKELPSIIEKYNSLKVEINNNNDILKYFEEVISYYKEKKYLDDSYIITYDKYQILDADYKIQEDKYFRNQAGIIANKLQKNLPCPVCGSINHPNPAKTESEVLTKEELELLKEKVEIQLKEVNVIKEKISSVKSKIDLINIKTNCKDEDETNKLSLEIKTKNERLSIAANKLKKEFDHIYQFITSSKIDIEKFSLLEFINNFNKENGKIKEELQSSRSLLEEYQHTLSKQKIILSKETKKLQELIKQIGFKDQDDYRKKLLSEENINALNEAVKQHEKEKTTNNIKLIEIEKSLTSNKSLDLTEDQNKLQGLQNELENLAEEKQKFYSIYDNNLKIHNKLVTTSKKLLEYMDKFSIYEELYKLSSGTLSGKRRISFEQYVQATYFDMVLYEANLRFQNMTDGRFKLLRKETAESLNSKFALDLDVYDEYNGSRRDVKSLSGGEAFKASLSLALGLSDVIQNFSGGIVIDTLFIDEGFGSLDQESREQAINTLNLISNNNKLIGIISHVSELKDRIDKKIIVTKNREGSQVNIVI